MGMTMSVFKFVILSLKAMAMKVVLLSLSICLMTVIFPINSTDLNWWCNQTPHPETCKYHHNHRLSSTTTYTSISGIQFQKDAILVAMNHALDVLNHIKWLGARSRGGAEKAALADCVQFYENTVFQLKRTRFFTIKPTAFDIQTWLSAAITNLQFCQNGFTELNVTNKFLPLTSINLTQLIGNTLAITTSRSVSPHKQSYISSFGFPSTVSREGQFSQLALDIPSDVVVAQDGSGNFSTVKEALDALHNRRNNSTRFVIHVKKGTYREYIEIGRNMTNITMIGDGLNHTIITGNRSNAGGYTTYDSATVKVIGDGFVAQDITFENSAGPHNGQAVALVSLSDLSAFYRCGFLGYQDTLFVFSQRQFYKECQIFGTVDFIFGNAAVVLQNCSIYLRKPRHGGGLVITAQARSNPNQTTGISIQKSTIMAAPELKPVLSEYKKAYLGRPWANYSLTVYMESFLDGIVDPAGWNPWDKDTATLSTLFYGEYNNVGPGSYTKQRVNWPGYRVIKDINTAKMFTVEEFIGGQSWLPQSHVPFFPSL